MRSPPCSTLARHQLAQDLTVHLQSSGESDDPRRWGKGLAALPAADRGLEYPDLGSHLGLGLWALTEQFAKKHDAFLAKASVASIAFCLESDCVDFTAVFREKLEASGLSHAGLAEKIGNLSTAMVSQVASGRRRIPIDAIESWASALGLSGQERTRFIMLAGLAHVRDERIRNLIASELETLRDEVRALAAAVQSRKRR